MSCVIQSLLRGDYKFHLLKGLAESLIHLLSSFTCIYLGVNVSKLKSAKKYIISLEKKFENVDISPGLKMNCWCVDSLTRFGKMSVSTPCSVKWSRKSLTCGLTHTLFRSETWPHGQPWLVLLAKDGTKFIIISNTFLTYVCAFWFLLWCFVMRYSS